jgi:hypothetical protein
MTYLSFQDESLAAVGEALEIAEDKTGDFYKFSIDQWKKHRYDVKTLESLADNEISSYGFALLNKYSRVGNLLESKMNDSDFYLICLQDHHIIDALRRDKNLKLLSLLVYIFTHELVHIVRFCNFFQRFEVSGMGKEREERLVHEITYKILQRICLPSMDYILESYSRHRLGEPVFS